MNLKAKLFYVATEFKDGLKAGLTPNRSNITRLSLLALVAMSSPVYAQGGTENVVKSVINWALMIAAAIFAFYISLDVRPVLRGEISVWKLLGKAFTGFLVLGIIALIANFKTISETFKGPLDSATQKVAEEVGGAVK